MYVYLCMFPASAVWKMHVLKVDTFTFSDIWLKKKCFNILLILFVFIRLTVILEDK